MVVERGPRRAERILKVGGGRAVRAALHDMAQDRQALRMAERAELLRVAFEFCHV